MRQNIRRFVVAAREILTGGIRVRFCMTKTQYPVNRQNAAQTSNPSGIAPWGSAAVLLQHRSRAKRGDTRVGKTPAANGVSG